MPHKYNPLLSELIQEVPPKSNFSATSNPGVTNDSSEGYEVGSEWANIIANKAYICLDATTGAAIWTETTSVTTDPPFERIGTIILPKVTTDTLKLLNPNAVSLSLGSTTEEGGDIIGYRDNVGNIGFSVDMDAASNEMMLYAYGSVVFPNNLTVGQSTLNTAYNLYVNGPIRSAGIRIEGATQFHAMTSLMTYSYIRGKSNDNFVVEVMVTDSSDHEVKLQIAGSKIIAVKATGDGAGGIIDLKAIIYEQLVYTPSGDTLITAAGGITVTKAIMRVAGNGGAIDITANPQIASGTDGQIVIIQGTHDVNTVTLDDGTGLSLSAQCILSAQDNITLVYDSGDAEWIETSRTTVI